MKREDISEAVGNISTKHIQEAAPGKMVNKKSAWVKWGAMAACLCLIVAASVAVPLLRDGNERWPIKELECPSQSDSEIAVVPKWEEMKISQQFPEANYNGIRYSSRTAELSADNIDAELGEVSMQGYDTYTDKNYNATAKIYRIASVSENCAVALRFDGQSEYYAYVNSYYQPETLGQFIDDLNLRDNLITGSVWQDKLDKNGEFKTYEYTGLDTDKVWSLLLSDTSLEAVRDYDAQTFETLMSISVDIPLLGYKNISLSVTAEGYLTTNILDTGKAFFIGTDKVNNFMQYVNDNCDGFQIVYVDKTEIPE